MLLLLSTSSIFACYNLAVLKDPILFVQKCKLKVAPLRTRVLPAKKIKTKVPSCVYSGSDVRNERRDSNRESKSLRRWGPEEALQPHHYRKRLGDGVPRNAEARSGFSAGCFVAHKRKVTGRIHALSLKTGKVRVDLLVFPWHRARMPNLQPVGQSWPPAQLIWLDFCHPFPTGLLDTNMTQIT